MVETRFLLTLFVAWCLFFWVVEASSELLSPAHSQSDSINVNIGASCSESSSSVELNFLFLLYTVRDKFQIPQRSLLNFFKMLKLCLESIRRSQNNAKVHIGIPEHQVKDWSTALDGQRVRVITIQVLPPAHESWVYKHTFYQKIVLQTALKGVENVILAEPDQLYWADMSPVFGYAFDVGVTFTKRRVSRRAGCLNSGIIFIKKVSDPIIKLWHRYAEETREICKNYGCRIGGENQRALCDILGGPGRKNENRTTIDGIRVRGFDKNSYNMLTPTSCSRTTHGVYMTHFKGALKTFMFKDKCRTQYIQSSAVWTRHSETSKESERCPEALLN